MKFSDPGEGDSAGIPWRGRTINHSPFAGDSGKADPELEQALVQWRSDEIGIRNLVTALTGKRVIVPVMAEVENLVVDPDTSLVSDKDSSTGVVCVSAPDGRVALPVFSSIPAMTRWNKNARPIPVEIERAALSAVSEQWPLLVVDPGDAQPPIIPRPAVWALAQGRGATWIPAPEDNAVKQELRRLLLPIEQVVEVDVDKGRRAETAVVLSLRPGLTKAKYDAVLVRVQKALSGSELIAERLDSVELRPQ